MAKQAPTLSAEQQRRVLTHVANGSYPQRNRIMLLLTWLAGMRVGEIAALNIENVISSDGDVRSVIHLRKDQTKGNAARTVHLNSQLRTELRSYVATIADTTNRQHPLITSKTGKRFSANGLCQRMLRLYDDAGVDSATSHSGRRTFITTLANKGVNVRVLAELAGHANIATTQRYIEINDGVLARAAELA